MNSTTVFTRCSIKSLWADDDNAKLTGRKLSADQIRLKSLNSLIEKTYLGKMATEREIRESVTEMEWAQYKETKLLCKPPKMPTFMRSQFTKYNALLRSADLRFDRVENSARTRMRLRGRYVPNHKNPYRLAERDYEHALEILEELLEVEPSARGFLDRPVSFDSGNAPRPDQNSVPRLLTSSSPYRLREGEHYPSNKELRLSTLLSSRDKLIGKT